MHPGQREAGLRMVELAIGPAGGVVALLAGGGESGMGHRTIRAVEIGLVARNASRIRDVVIVIDVAVGTLTGRHGVRSGQGKCGLRMVKRRRLPGRSRMAKFAGLGKSSRHVIGIFRTVEIGLVTIDTCGAGQVVIVLLVTIRAHSRGVRVQPGQGEAGDAVIESRIRPLDRVMAVLAGGGESLVRHGTGRVVVVILVA